MDMPIIAQIAASLGIALTVVQYWMKTMIPLRVVGIITNVLFLLYSGLSNIWPTFVLNCIVLPLNTIVTTVTGFLWLEHNYIN